VKISANESPNGEVSGDSALQSFTLESLESAVNYHGWLTSLALPYLGDDPVELGSGLGDYAQRWIAAGAPQVTATELDPSRVAYLKERLADEPRVHVKRMDVAAPDDGAHSCLVAFNVLEHIEDDVAALRGARKLLRPGGYVVMYVPAFPFALGAFDRKVGHFRRYTIKTLRAAYEAAGLSVHKIHYVNMPGLLTWFVAVRLLRMTPSDGLAVRLWDRFITPRARAWEAKHRPPFGQSVLCVGQVPTP
jgi:SAM-dependent methyltransferase